MKRSPYPLQWPPGVTRTKPGDRMRSAFGGRSGRENLSPYSTGVELEHELFRLGATTWVITSCLPSRGPHGVPHADPPSGVDPGIAVWFDYDGIERALACDRWHRPAENLRAITKSIEAMRGLERWGVADVLANVFTGFAAALPPGAPEPVDWRRVLGVQVLFDELLASDTDSLIAVVKAKHRKLMATAHIDAGGSSERMLELNQALEAAERELAGDP